MKVILVPGILLLAAASAYGYGSEGVSAGMTAFASTALTEPMALLLSGSALLVLAGALRRLQV